MKRKTELDATEFFRQRAMELAAAQQKLRLIRRIVKSMQGPDADYGWVEHCIEELERVLDIK